MICSDWPYSQGVYDAFAAIKKAGFSVYCCGQRRAPHVLVCTLDQGDYMDVINIRGGDRVTAARLPTYDGLNIFAPTQAVWHYMGDLETTVAAILHLSPPEQPDTPTSVYPAPVSMFVTSGEQRPMTVKLGRQA
jgi:hypothetical protein